MNGRSVWQSTANTNNADYIEWQTDNTQPGVYFYTVLDNNRIIQNGRVAIVK